MKTFTLMCLLLAIGIFSSYAHAQVAGCAPGDIPWTGSGVSTCLPGNTRSQPRQAPPPQWESRWGAIATDISHGVIGSSANMTSDATAQSSAMTDCQNKGGTNCIMQESFSNGCGILILGDKGFNVNWGDSEAIAIQKGMAVCTANDTGCHVYLTTCSPAARVQ